MGKKIADNSPKYVRIVEPFGDGGTFALYLAKKPPKTHLVNIEDETLFPLYVFVKEHTAADKRTLKGYDWVSSPETFDKVMALTATDGPELYYRRSYMMKFGIKAKDPDTPPAYDWLKLGHDAGSVIYDLPLKKFGLKKVELALGDPIVAMTARRVPTRS